MFEQIIGQDAIKAQLKATVSGGHVAHAQLFAGPSGAGKLPMALAYAKLLLCSHPDKGEPCGQCPNCKKVEKLAHPDLHFVFPVVKPKGAKTVACDDFLVEWRALLSESAYISLDDWLVRMGAENQQAMIYEAESAAILRKLSLKSSEGGRKVMIIWLPEKMNVTCANKLLKLFEEPSEDTIFLLVSEEPDQLLTTISSRMQRINFPRLSDEEVAVTLMERNGLGEKDARSVARCATGSYTKALGMLRAGQDNEVFFQLFVSLMRLCYQRKIKDMKAWSEQVAAMGRERQKNLLAFCQRLIRENFIYNFHKPELNYLTQQEADFAKNFARFVNERNVIGISEELALAQRDIEGNVNPRMVFFDFALKMIVLLIQ